MEDASGGTISCFNLKTYKFIKSKLFQSGFPEMFCKLKKKQLFSRSSLTDFVIFGSLTDIFLLSEQTTH